MQRYRREKVERRRRRGIVFGYWMGLTEGKGDLEIIKANRPTIASGRTKSAKSKQTKTTKRIGPIKCRSKP